MVKVLCARGHARRYCIYRDGELVLPDKANRLWRAVSPTMAKKARVPAPDNLMEILRTTTVPPPPACS